MASARKTEPTSGLRLTARQATNPPFSLEKWGEDVWINDPYGRNFAGSMARKTGRMAVVLPHGVLFRMSKEGEIRHKLLEMKTLEAVIGLDQNVFTTFCTLLLGALASPMFILKTSVDRLFGLSRL